MMQSIGSFFLKAQRGPGFHFPLYDQEDSKTETKNKTEEELKALLQLDTATLIDLTHRLGKQFNTIFKDVAAQNKFYSALTMTYSIQNLVKPTFESMGLWAQYLQIVSGLSSMTNYFTGNEQAADSSENFIAFGITAQIIQSSTSFATYHVLQKECKKVYEKSLEIWKEEYKKDLTVLNDWENHHFLAILSLTKSNPTLKLQELLELTQDTQNKLIDIKTQYFCRF